MKVILSNAHHGRHHGCILSVGVEMGPLDHHDLGEVRKRLSRSSRAEGVEVVGSSSRSFPF